MAVNRWQFTCTLGYKEKFGEFLLWAVPMFGGRFLFNPLMPATGSRRLAARRMEGQGQSQRLGGCKTYTPPPPGPRPVLVQPAFE